MTGGRTIVFVHGKGGFESRQAWLGPLNTGLSALGYPVIGAHGDRIIEADYLVALLAGDDGHTPGVEWTKPPARARHDTWADFLVRREALAEAIEQSRNTPGPVHAGLFSGTPLPDSIAGTMEGVATYRSSSRHRHAAWRAMLACLPETGRVTVVAHSLGSILMIDLLTRLPPGLQVDLLLTIGSPMGVKGLRSHHGGIETAGGFPADRVLRWLNVYDPGDIITVGRGASPFFQAALDAPVRTGGSHSLVGYMSHPVIAAAVGHAMFSEPGQAVVDAPMSPPRVDGQGVPSRRLDPRWDPLLLRFAYTQQLWATCDTGKWGFRRRIDAARRILARRTIEDIATRHASQPADVSELSPLHPSRAPTQEDLLVHAAGLVRGQMSDAQLVVAAVDFLLAPTLPPFDLDIADRHAHEALAALLANVRRASPANPAPSATSAPSSTPAPSAQDVSEAVIASVRDSKAALSESGFPWGPVLITAGIGLLAATGVGLAVAAPAGLAGAAAIASTLATFGPGGMVGGIATLTALTGAATAMTSLGVVVELTPSDPRYEQVRDAMAVQLAEQSAPQLRTSVAGMLAVLGAQRRLGLPSDAANIEELLLRTESLVQHERGLHAEIAPGRPGTKEWRTKASILGKALGSLDRNADALGLPAAPRAVIRREIEQG
ncbi:MAG: hypothetical protein F2892_02590 [Actinobacteria bacterium]|uniref:Unannotated protein n=1 Tax=freshwater metagenome TaxID=449393 RepID=A0A6J7PL70_9ZZZZ|nr:hypothetical protein [Actinomycetota bacterium]